MIFSAILIIAFIVVTLRDDMMLKLSRRHNQFLTWSSPEVEIKVTRPLENQLATTPGWISSPPVP